MSPANVLSRTWRHLESGDHVRLISPASYPDVDLLDQTRSTLESWGLVVEVGRHALDQWGYMAGRDEDRLGDVNDALRDPAVRAVFATRGGAGAYRIIDGIDFAAARSDPKPFIGFSDITAIHLALLRRCGFVNIYGCVVGEEANSSARTLLMSDEPLVIPSDPSAYSAGVQVAGKVTGRLIGGHLTTLAHSVGVNMPHMDGAILVVEDFRGMGLGRVDRQLTQLHASGALDGIVGVALGLFTGFDDLVDRDWTLLDVLRDQLGRLNVPILGGLKIGHGGLGADGNPDQSCVALGRSATLDTDARTLTIL